MDTCPVRWRSIIKKLIYIHCAYLLLACWYKKNCWLNALRVYVKRADSDDGGSTASAIVVVGSSATAAGILTRRVILSSTDRWSGSMVVSAATAKTGHSSPARWAEAAAVPLSSSGRPAVEVWWWFLTDAESWAEEEMTDGVDDAKLDAWMTSSSSCSVRFMTCCSSCWRPDCSRSIICDEQDCVRDITNKIEDANLSSGGKLGGTVPYSFRWFWWDVLDIRQDYLACFWTWYPSGYRKWQPDIRQTKRLDIRP